MKKTKEKPSIYFLIEKKTLRDEREDCEWGRWETDYDCSVLSFTKEPNKNCFYPYYEKFNLSKNEFDKIKDEVWAVIVTYVSGDSFGYSSGNIDIACATTNLELAKQAAISIKEGQWSKFSKSNSGVCCSYESWTGYFDSLTGIDIQLISLGEVSKIKIL